MTVRCRSCLGVYATESEDGVPYRHACGPVPLVAVTRDGAALEVPRWEVAPDDLVRVARGGRDEIVTGKDIDVDDVVPVARRARPLDARDEHAPRSGGEDEDGRPVKRRGRGVDILAA